MHGSPYACLKLESKVFSRKSRSVATTYLWWTFLRAIFHRGWWLVTSLYLVVEAGLSPLQLVFLGTAQGITVIAFEIPVGVIADNYSRKWSIVIAHVLMGTGMLATGLVTAFPALVLTQMIWGLSWTFSSGADVAWLNDELDQPDRIGPLLGKAARWSQLGAALGIVLFGLLAWQTSLSVAIVTAGSLMLVLGSYVISSFAEHRFSRPEKSGFGGFFATLRRGVEITRSDRSIMIVLAVTVLVNGADEVFSRLLPKGLIELGLPQDPDPVLWLMALGLATLGVAAIMLRIVENRLLGEPSLRILYLSAGFLGGCGILLFALAPNYWVGMAGAVVVHGIAWNLVRVIGVIWVNGRSDSQQRATLQSFLAQAENLGEVVIGFGLALIAEFIGMPLALVVAALVVALAFRLMTGMKAER